MKINKNTILALIVFCALIGGSLFLILKTTKNELPPYAPPNRLPGTSIPTGDGWFVYKNVPIGISVEYPDRKTATHSLQPYAEMRKNNDEKYYYIGFQSHADVEYLTIEITPTDFNNIDEWKDYFKTTHWTEKVLYSHKIIGGLDSFVAHFQPFVTDGSCATNTEAYIIKNEMLYAIKTFNMPVNDVERIWNSFRFIENE